MADEENRTVEETTPAPEASAAEDTAAPSAPKGEPVPQLAPKERRQQARAAKAA